MKEAESGTPWPDPVTHSMWQEAPEYMANPVTDAEADLSSKQGEDPLELKQQKWLQKAQGAFSLQHPPGMFLAKAKQAKGGCER